MFMPTLANPISILHMSILYKIILENANQLVNSSMGEWSCLGVLKEGEDPETDKHL